MPAAWAARGRVNPRQDMHEGALAGAVLAQQGVDLAGTDVEVHAIKRADARECLRNSTGFQQRGGRGTSAHCCMYWICFA
jgi:hypothetical protein